MLPGAFHDLIGGAQPYHESKVAGAEETGQWKLSPSALFISSASMFSLLLSAASASCLPVSFMIQPGFLFSLSMYFSPGSGLLACEQTPAF